MIFKKIILLMSPMFISLSANAVDLRVITVEINPASDTPLATVKEMARKEILKKLGDPSKYKRVSAWNDWASSAPPSCYSCERRVSGGAQTSFIEASREDEEWYVEFEASSSTTDSPYYEAEGWRLAEYYAEPRAKTYCGGEITPFRITRIGMDIDSENSHPPSRIYLINARYICVKHETYNPEQ